jgi:hypothetical protein
MVETGKVGVRGKRYALGSSGVRGYTGVRSYNLLITVANGDVL